MKKQIGALVTEFSLNMDSFNKGIAKCLEALQSTPMPCDTELTIYTYPEIAEDKEPKE